MSENRCRPEKTELRHCSLHPETVNHRAWLLYTVVEDSINLPLIFIKVSLRQTTSDAPPTQSVPMYVDGISWGNFYKTTV